MDGRKYIKLYVVYRVVPHISLPNTKLQCSIVAFHFIPTRLETVNVSNKGPRDIKATFDSNIKKNWVGI